MTSGMKAWRLTWAVVGGLALAAFCPAAIRADEKKDRKKPDDAKALAGTWAPESAELGGVEFPDEVRKSIKLVLGDGKYTAEVGGAKDEGTYKIDAAKKPATLDITGTEGPNKGKTIPAIYKLEKDRLTVCYDLSGKSRPKEFATKKGTQLFLVVYERVKE